MAGGISIEMTGANEAIKRLGMMEVEVAATSQRIVMQCALAVQNAAQRRAPVLTGTLRRSITTIDDGPQGATGWKARVGPTVIYGRRIELGFVGADSLGRHYNQKGKPYFKPASDLVAPQLGRKAAAMWAEVLGR